MLYALKIARVRIWNHASRRSCHESIFSRYIQILDNNCSVHHCADYRSFLNLYTIRATIEIVRAITEITVKTCVQMDNDFTYREYIPNCSFRYPLSVCSLGISSGIFKSPFSPVRTAFLILPVSYCKSRTNFQSSPKDSSTLFLYLLNCFHFLSSQELCRCFNLSAYFLESSVQETCLFYQYSYILRSFLRLQENIPCQTLTYLEPPLRLTQECFFLFQTCAHSFLCDILPVDGRWYCVSQ